MTHQAAAFIESPREHGIIPMWIGRPAQFLLPTLPLPAIVRRVRSPAELGGAALAVVADCAAELGHRMRAARPDEQIQPWVWGEWLVGQTFLSSGECVACLADRNVCPTIDPLMAGRAAVEAGNAARVVVDGQLGQPYLLDGRRPGGQPPQGAILPLILLPCSPAVGRPHPHRRRQQREHRDGKRHVHPSDVVICLVAGQHGGI